MTKMIIGIFVIILLIGSVFGCAKSEDEDGKEMMISVTQDLILDAKSTTGPLPPSDYDAGLETSLLRNQKIINGIPSYIWYNGCGPTAAGMLIGYWDLQGFDDLVNESASYQTIYVKSMISSNGNYNDYCLPKDYRPNLLSDKSEPPFDDEHDDNCIADFMKTSQSYYQNYYGWSKFSDMDDAISDYIIYRNSAYEPLPHTYIFNTILWEKYCIEIDEGRPAIFLVDSAGDGKTDHFVTCIGYDENKNYACYNTWDNTIHWYDFSGISNGNKWGVYGATFCSFNFYPTQPLNPQPSNGSVNMDKNITLRWECEDLDGDNLYHIYFGETKIFYEDDLLISNLTKKYYNISNLENNTQYFWKVVSEDEDDFKTESNIWCFYTTDTEPPIINISYPKVGYLYLSGDQKRETLFGKTIVIGEILICLIATDNLGLGKVEFYIDDYLKFTDNDSFSWMWNEKMIGKHILKAVVYDLVNNTNSVEIEIWKLF